MSNSRLEQEDHSVADSEEPAKDSQDSKGSTINSDREVVLVVHVQVQVETHSAIFSKNSRNSLEAARELNVAHQEGPNSKQRVKTLS